MTKVAFVVGFAALVASLPAGAQRAAAGDAPAGEVRQAPSSQGSEGLVTRYRTPPDPWTAGVDGWNRASREVYRALDRARMLIGVGDLAGAEAECELADRCAVRLKDGSLWPTDSNAELGVIRLKQGRNREALECFLACRRRRPDSYVQNWLAIAYARLGDMPAARLEFTNGLFRADPEYWPGELPGTDTATHLEASAWIVMGVWDGLVSGIPYLQTALQVVPGNPLARYRLARALIALREYGDALDIFRDLARRGNGALAKAANDRVGEIETVVREREREADARAREMAERARALAPQYPLLPTPRADGREHPWPELAAITRAVTLAQGTAAGARVRDAADVEYGLARRLYAEGDMVGAEVAGRRALALSQEPHGFAQDDRAQVLLGAVFLAQGRNVEAARWLSQGGSIPASAERYPSLVIALCRAGDFREAAHWYAVAEQWPPTAACLLLRDADAPGINTLRSLETTAWLMRAIALVRTGEPGLALRDLREAERLMPANPVVSFLLGERLGASRQYREAIAYLRAAASAGHGRLAAEAAGKARAIERRTRQAAE